MSEEELNNLWSIILDLREEKRRRWAKEPCWLDKYIKRLVEVYEHLGYQSPLP